VAQPPEAIQFKKEDFPSTGLSTGPALDGLFVPLNRILEATRDCLDRGVGVADNSAFEVRKVRVTTPSTDWVTPALLNSWVDNAGGGEVPGYRKDEQGEVQGRGQVKNGVIGSAAFALDTLYLPPGLKLLPATANNAGTVVIGELRVDTSGNVTPFVGANSYFSLDALRFMAADRTPVPLSCFPVDIVLQRVSSPLGVALLGVRDITSPQNGGGTDPVLALGTPKLTSLSATRLRLQNLPGLLLGRCYELTLCVFV
jgi:hypothetical protein